MGFRGLIGDGIQENGSDVGHEVRRFAAERRQVTHRPMRFDERERDGGRRFAALGSRKRDRSRFMDLSTCPFLQSPLPKVGETEQ